MGDLQNTGINRLGQLFNEYAGEFSKITKETDKDFIINTGDIIFFIFGSDARKNEEWKKRHPNCGESIYFISVSSKPIEIWLDVREVVSGKYKGQLVINKLSLGHEIVHALRIAMSKWTLKNEDDGIFLSPDKYLNI